MKQSTLLLALAGLLSPFVARADLINELVANPPSIDPPFQEVELTGTPGSVFDLWLISIESDVGAANPGTVDRSTNIFGTYDAHGLAVVTIPDLENPSFTLALIDVFGGIPVGLDLDPADAGFLDPVPLGTVLDIIGVPDHPGDQWVTDSYAFQFGGASLFHAGGEPEQIFREASTGMWHANWSSGAGVADEFGVLVDPLLFDKAPTDSTFGSANPSFDLTPPVPDHGSTLSLLLLGIVGVGLSRRTASRR